MVTWQPGHGDAVAVEGATSSWPIADGAVPENVLLILSPLLQRATGGNVVLLAGDCFHDSPSVVLMLLAGCRCCNELDKSWEEEWALFSMHQLCP